VLIVHSNLNEQLQLLHVLRGRNKNCVVINCS
jgi:hypothetical protein